MYSSSANRRTFARIMQSKVTRAHNHVYYSRCVRLGHNRDARRRQHPDMCGLTPTPTPDSNAIATPHFNAPLIPNTATVAAA